MSMRPHRSPEGDHSEHMDHRRATAPWLFNKHGSYKNWAHIFSIRRNMDGVGSVEHNDHYSLPWELEDTTLRRETLETLDAHYVVHGMKEWHPHWPLHWQRRDVHQGINPALYWVMLNAPGINYLAGWMLEEKRRIRIEHPYCDAARIVTQKLLSEGLKQYLIRSNNQPGD